LVAGIHEPAAFKDSMPDHTDWTQGCLSGSLGETNDKSKIEPENKILVRKSYNTQEGMEGSGKS
jgi:hypothetical protein